jgi:hypothetical protein
MGLTTFCVRTADSLVAAHAAIHAFIEDAYTSIVAAPHHQEVSPREGMKGVKCAYNNSTLVRVQEIDFRGNTRTH